MQGQYNSHSKVKFTDRSFGFQRYNITCTSEVTIDKLFSFVTTKINTTFVNIVALRQI